MYFPYYVSQAFPIFITSLSKNQAHIKNFNWISQDTNIKFISHREGVLGEISFFLQGLKLFLDKSSRNQRTLCHSIRDRLLQWIEVSQSDKPTQIFQVRMSIFGWTFSAFTLRQNVTEAKCYSGWFVRCTDNVGQNVILYVWALSLREYFRDKPPAIQKERQHAVIVENCHRSITITHVRRQGSPLVSSRLERSSQESVLWFAFYEDDILPFFPISLNYMVIMYTSTLSMLQRQGRLIHH